MYGSTSGACTSPRFSGGCDTSGGCTALSAVVVAVANVDRASGVLLLIDYLDYDVTLVLVLHGVVCFGRIIVSYAVCVRGVESGFFLLLSRQKILAVWCMYPGTHRILCSSFGA